MSLLKYLGNKHTGVLLGMSLVPCLGTAQHRRVCGVTPLLAYGKAARQASERPDQLLSDSRACWETRKAETPKAANPSGSCIPPLTSAIQLWLLLSDNCHFLFGAGKLCQNPRTPAWMEVRRLRHTSSGDQYKQARRKLANKLPSGHR